MIQDLLGFEEISDFSNALSVETGFIGELDGHAVYEFRIDDISFVRFLHSPLVEISYHINTGNLDMHVDFEQMDVMDVLVYATGVSWNDAIDLADMLMNETEGDGIIQSSYRVVNNVRFTLQRTTMGIHSLTIEPEH